MMYKNSAVIERFPVPRSPYIGEGRYHRKGSVQIISVLLVFFEKHASHTTCINITLSSHNDRILKHFGHNMTINSFFTQGN